MIGLRVAQALHRLRVSAAASSAINLMRWLTGHGHQALLVSGAGEREEDILEEGFHYLRYKDGGTGWWFGGRRKLIQDIRDWRPDLLHVHQLDATSLFLGISAKLKVPLIVSLQAEPDAQALDLLRDSGVRMLTVPSGALRAKLISGHGFDRDRVAVLPYGLDLARYPVADPVTSVRRIACVGRFEEAFGFGVLLGALARLKAEGIELQATIVGGGDGAGRLDGEIERLRLGETVRIVPGVPRTGRLLARHDCFVYPAREDVLQIGVLKAMACARPVVASAVGSMPEWIRDGHNGLLVPPGDEAALAAALASLAGDPALANRLGAAARSDVATTNDLDRVGSAVHELYRHALRRGRGTEVETTVITAYRRISACSDEAPGSAGQQTG